MSSATVLKQKADLKPLNVLLWKPMKGRTNYTCLDRERGKVYLPL